MMCERRSVDPRAWPPLENCQVFRGVLPEDINEYFAISLMLIRERSLGPASFFSPYIDVLPTAEEVSASTTFIRDVGLPCRSI